MQLPARLAVCSLFLALAAPLGAQSAMSEAAAPANSFEVLTPVAPATPTASQAAQPAPQTAAQTQPVAGAPMSESRVAVHAPERARTDAPAATAAAHANLGQSRALMAVGVAGLIVGAIIGGTPGTIIMVGGAVIGLKGLYDYLQ